MDEREQMIEKAFQKWMESEDAKASSVPIQALRLAFDAGYEAAIEDHSESIYQ